MNGEYEMKTYYDDSLLSQSGKSSNYITADEASNKSSFLSEPSIISKKYNTSNIKNSTSSNIGHDHDDKDNEHFKEKKSVHKRLSRNFNRILNNFNNMTMDHNSHQKVNKEKEKLNEKENNNSKEMEKDKSSKNNVQRTRKGIKLMERKIKGLSLSHLLKQNKNDENGSNDHSKHLLKERHSFSVLSLTNSERQKIEMISKLDKHSNHVKEKEFNPKFNTKKSNTKSSSKSKHYSQNSKQSLKSYSKRDKEEKSLESSRKYYETLTNILKRNKENSKKEKMDYSTFLNDIDIKVTSNSNDTINQLTEIYHSYTGPDKSNESNSKDDVDVSHNPSFLSSTNQGNVSSATFGYQSENNQDDNISYAPEKDQTMSTIEKRILKDNESMSSMPSLDEKSTHMGEFDDNTSSFYQNLNEEKHNFNQNIYNFNKYESEEDNNNDLEEGDMEISSSTDIINSFDLKSIDDDKVYSENNDFIKKTHSYTSTDIYSYYANLNSSKNNDELVKTQSIKNSKKNKEEYLDEKNNLNAKKLINNEIYNINNEKNNKNATIEKETIEENSYKGNLNSNINEKNGNENENENENGNGNENENEKNSTLITTLDKMRKYSSRNTEEYENEIHNIRNFLEEQNETINADFSKFSNDEAEYTNMSSFATSVHSTYISSSQREDKSLSSTSEKNLLFEEEKVQLMKDNDDIDNENKNSLHQGNIKIEEYSNYYKSQKLKDYFQYDNDNEEEVEDKDNQESNDNYNGTSSFIKNNKFDDQNNTFSKEKKTEVDYENKMYNEIEAKKESEVKSKNEYLGAEEITEVASETIYNEPFEKPSEETTYPVTEEKTEDIQKRK